MRSIINELWHGNIIPQEDSRTNSKEMKELLGYMSRHHEDLEKSFSDEQKESFEKFHDCWSEYMSLAEAAIFEYAFKLGMQIAIETLKQLKSHHGLSVRDGFLAYWISVDILYCSDNKLGTSFHFERVNCSFNKAYLFFGSRSLLYIFGVSLDTS